MCCLVAFIIQLVKEQKKHAKLFQSRGKQLQKSTSYDDDDDDDLSQTMTYKWFKCFKNGRTSTDGYKQSG
jgi:hypothetical protein